MNTESLKINILTRHDVYGIHVIIVNSTLEYLINILFTT